MLGLRDGNLSDIGKALRMFDNNILKRLFNEVAENKTENTGIPKARNGGKMLVNSRMLRRRGGKMKGRVIGKEMGNPIIAPRKTINDQFLFNDGGKLRPE